ncbi:MAG: hypothetical protein ACREP9_20085, partial [Candidatus Dormibacteraceae bacterium]
HYLTALGISLTVPELRAHIDHLAAPHHQGRLDYEESTAGRDGSGSPDLSALLRLTLQRAYERVTDGSQEVGVRDAVALLKIKRELERDAAEEGQQATAEQWQAALTRLLWIARRHLGKNWAAFATDVRSDEMIAMATGGKIAEPADQREVTGVSAAAGAAEAAGTGAD